MAHTDELWWINLYRATLRPALAGIETSVQAQGINLRATMSKPSSRRNFRKPNHGTLGLAGALGDDTGDSDNDLGGNLEDNSSRAQRFATNLEGNRFREVRRDR